MPSRNVVLLGLAVVAATLTSCGQSSSPEPCQGSPENCPTAPAGTDGPLAQDLPPVAGAGLSFAAVSSSGYSITWRAAKDDHTAVAQLQYQVVSAAAASSLATLQQVEALAAAAVVLPWSANALTTVVTARPPNETTTYAVLVKDAAGNRSLYPAAAVTTLAESAPVPGTGIVLSSVGRTALVVTWGAAAQSGTSSLSYKVVYASASTLIDSVAKADAITGSAATPWLPPGSTGVSISGLSPATTYAFAVVVKTGSGSESLYQPVTTTTLP